MSKRVISEEVALKSVEKVTEDLGTLTELLEKHDGDQAKVDQMFNLSQSCGKCKDLLRTCTASGNTDTKALGSSLEEAIRKLKAAMDQDFYKEQCAHDFFKSLWNGEICNASGLAIADFFQDSDSEKVSVMRLLVDLSIEGAALLLHSWQGWWVWFAVGKHSFDSSSQVMSHEMVRYRSFFLV